MALDITKHNFAAGAPLSALNYGSNNRYAINGNPFAANSQEFQEYENMDAAGYWDASAAVKMGMDPQEAASKEVEYSMKRLTNEYFSKAKEFDEKNPFAFDEALATSAATEKLTPYYSQKLGDFMQGITTQRTRSIEDEQKLLTTISQDTNAYTGKNQFIVNQAVNQAKEGMADAGLFDSGIAKAKVGEIKAESNMNLSDYLRGQGNRADSAMTNKSRALEDLTNTQTMGTRDINREKQVDVLGEVNTAKNEANRQHEMERVQYLGPAPGETAESFDQRRFNMLGI